MLLVLVLRYLQRPQGHLQSQLDSVKVKTVVEPSGVKDCFGNELTNPCVGVVPINGILYSYVICIKPRTASSDEARTCLNF